MEILEEGGENIFMLTGVHTEYRCLCQVWMNSNVQVSVNGGDRDGDR